MSKRRANNNIDGAKGEKYLASPERRAFMQRLAKRLTDTVEFDAKDPARQGLKQDETYSLTRSTRYVPPEYLG